MTKCSLLMSQLILGGHTITPTGTTEGKTGERHYLLASATNPYKQHMHSHMHDAHRQHMHAPHTHFCHIHTGLLPHLGLLAWHLSIWGASPYIEVLYLLQYPTGHSTCLASKLKLCFYYCLLAAALSYSLRQQLAINFLSFLLIISLPY